MALFDKFIPNKKSEVELTPVLPQDIYEAGRLSFLDLIAPSALEITPNRMRISEKFSRTLFIFSYPRFLHTNWFSPIVNIDQVFDISVFIHTVDTALILRQLRKKVAQVQAGISDREDRGLVRDPILDTAYRDLEDLRYKLQQAQERLFNFGLYITIYADSEDGLDSLEREVTSMLEARLVYSKPAIFQQRQGFESTLPLGQDKLLVHSYLNSSPVSSTFPFVSFDMTSNKGILYGINRHNNSLILFDRFS